MARVDKLIHKNSMIGATLLPMHTLRRSVASESAGVSASRQGGIADLCAFSDVVISANDHLGGMHI